ncbi:unnamed protein product [Colias eurytheme]|nr:unnamed protein product [Colias eurytheme]
MLNVINIGVFLEISYRLLQMQQSVSAHSCFGSMALPPFPAPRGRPPRAAPMHLAMYSRCTALAIKTVSANAGQQYSFVRAASLSGGARVRGAGGGAEGGCC